MPLITKNVIMDLEKKSVYIVRWSLWLPFGISIKLHKIMRPDTDRGCTHDHPWSFIRIILSGSYTEKYGPDNRITVRKPWRPWAPWRIYFCPASFRHTILKLNNPHSWTVVICGRKLREWGFFTKVGWMPWNQFVKDAKTNRVLWCEEEPDGLR